MVRNSRRRRNRQRQPDSPPSHTDITSLSDEVLAEILLRLPSLASLTRVGLACPRWRCVTSSRAFLRRFRDLHPSPPLLGCFATFVSDKHAGIPEFHRARNLADRHLAAAVRGGDFLLTSFDERRWCLKDCRHGLLLLISSDQLAVFDPVARRSIYVRYPAPADYRSFVYCLLPACGGGDDSSDASFRVVSLEQNTRQRVRARVYSSRTGVWRSHPWAPPSIKAPPQKQGQDHSTFPSMHAAGRIYWKNRRGSLLLSLDTTPSGSMEFSHVALPPVPFLSWAQAPPFYAVGDMEDGACCLVCVVSVPPYNTRVLQVWLRREEDGSWELEREVKEMILCACGERIVVNQVCSVTAGAVLLRVDHGARRHRYLAFRLKNLHPRALLYYESNLKLEADFFACSGCVAYPYFMAWPRSACSSPSHSDTGFIQEGDVVTG